MTILLYSGTPGSGKSLHATKEIYDSLHYKKKPVICNYELYNLGDEYEKSFVYCPNHELHPDKLIRFSANYWKRGRFKEDGILLVIDECQLLFNSRNWADKTRMAWLEFFSQHRKYGYKVLFIAQSDQMIDKQFRALIEYDVNHRKFSNYGFMGQIVKLLCFGEMFLWVQYYYQKNVKVHSQWFRCTKKLTNLYNSYGSFQRLESQPTA